jgi:hypothetical protein
MASVRCWFSPWWERINRITKVGQKRLITSCQEQTYQHSFKKNQMYKHLRPEKKSASVTPRICLIARMAPIRICNMQKIGIEKSIKRKISEWRSGSYLYFVDREVRRPTPSGQQDVREDISFDR